MSLSYLNAITITSTYVSVAFQTTQNKKKVFRKSTIENS